jgi:hypothetical protein
MSNITDRPRPSAKPPKVRRLAPTGSSPRRTTRLKLRRTDRFRRGG